MFNSTLRNPAGRPQGQDKIWRVSQSSCNGDYCRTQPPASMIHWDSSYYFSLQTLSWLSRIFRVGLWIWAHRLPKWPAFLNEAPFLSTDTCLSNYWFSEWQEAKPEFGNTTKRKNPFFLICIWASSNYVYLLRDKKGNKLKFYLKAYVQMWINLSHIR